MTTPPEIVIARESLDAHMRSCRARLARANPFPLIRPMDANGKRLHLEATMCEQMLELIAGTWPTGAEPLVSYEEGWSQDAADRGMWPFVDEDGNPDYEPARPAYMRPAFDSFDWIDPASS